MMRTSIDSYLTGQQLEALFILRDGEWHDRKYIHSKIGFKKFNYSIISERIIKPLEANGIIEQEERPGTKKKFVRIRKDHDTQTLYKIHSLITHSANDQVMKYRHKNAERAKFFLTIRDESIKKLDELEKLEEEEETEYWAQRMQAMDSENWRELIRLQKLIYDELKTRCKPCCKNNGLHEADCYLLKKPGAAFMIASMLNKDLIDEILQEERNAATSTP